MPIIKKSFKLLFVLIAFFVIGGFAGVLSERFLMPWLSSKSFFSKYKFFQKANENVTVINKTEQITVKEDYSVVNTSKNILPSVVSIITYGIGSKVDGVAASSNQDFTKITSSQDIQKYIKTGLILTNDGVIISVRKEGEPYLDAADSGVKFRVLMADGRAFDAKVLSTDPFTNVVLYKVDATNLPVPAFGNSDELEIGEKIVICGNAGGDYQNAYSMGIVREKDKTFTPLNSELSSSEKFEGAVLTDSVIDWRNIGGPVIDFSGNVAGIANQVEKDGKQVGYIIPINTLKNSLDMYIKNSSIKRPVFGVYYLSINKEVALLNSLPVERGALVYSFLGQQGLAVLKNSPADKSGIKLGDIILKVNNDDVTLDNPLSSLIASKNIGEELTLKVLREGKEVEIKVKLE